MGHGFQIWKFHLKIKGQLISKRFFEVVDFLQKMNENNSHTSKNELFHSFFGGNQCPHKPFRNQLTFTAAPATTAATTKIVEPTTTAVPTTTALPTTESAPTTMAATTTTAAPTTTNTAFTSGTSSERIQQQEAATQDGLVIIIVNRDGNSSEIFIPRGIEESRNDKFTFLGVRGI